MGQKLYSKTMMNKRMVLLMGQDSKNTMRDINQCDVSQTVVGNKMNCRALVSTKRTRFGPNKNVRIFY